MKTRINVPNKWLSFLVYSIVSLFLISIVIPFWTVFLDSVNPTELARNPGLKLWPQGFTLEAYTEVFGQENIGIAYLNTIYRTVLGSFLVVMVSFCAAFPLSRQRLPFRKFLTMAIIFTMFFSGGMIPAYIVVRGMNLLNTHLVLILPLLFSGFYILIMRNFMYSIPEELEESALLDGANEARICVSIFLPLSVPVLATIGLFAAVMYWNEWFQAMLYTRDPDKMVMQLLLRRVLLENQLSSIVDIDEIYTNNILSEESVRAAIIFVAVAPIMMAYPFVQRYFITGIMSGAVKG